MPANTDNGYQTQLDFHQPVLPYATVNYSNDYFSDTLTRKAAWFSVPEQDPSAPLDRISALREATLQLDQQYWVGHKLIIQQIREWPRYLGIGSYGDIFYLEQSIPVIIAQGCCEQAWYILNNTLRGVQLDERLDHQAQGIFSVTRAGGTESADPRHARTHKLCPEAYNLVRPLLAKTGNLDRVFRSVQS